MLNIKLRQGLNAASCLRCHSNINHRMAMYAPHNPSTKVLHILTFPFLYCTVSPRKPLKTCKKNSLNVRGGVCGSQSVSIWLYWKVVTETKASSPISRSVLEPCAEISASGSKHCTLPPYYTLLQVCTPHPCTHHTTSTHTFALTPLWLTKKKKSIEFWNLRLRF